jgi:myo-inositol catabolism protein IolC
MTDLGAESYRNSGDRSELVRQSAAGHDRVLLILAVDQRNSFERDLYGLKGPVSSVQAARISADKLLVYEALLEAVPQLPAGVQAGILVDEQYGASVAELAARSERAAVSLAMPIEKSGQEWFEFAYDDDWVAHAEFFATDHVKILVRDNPGFEPSRRERQAAKVAQVSLWAASNDRSLIIELLVPATDADTAAVDGDSVRYDQELRPGHTVAAIEYLQDQGVAPAIWKVEGLDRQQEAESIVNTANRNGRKADCILLGRHASHDQVDRWIQVVAPMPGWTGFAIGRSIWWDALKEHLHHDRTEDETRRRVCEAYLDFARFYVDARGGITGSGRALGCATT